MNAEGHKKIQSIIEKLSSIKDALADMSSEEQEKFDNMSEGLQSSENGQKTEQTASSLSAAADELDNVIFSLNEIE